jgi:hypothetical protein
MGRSLPSLLLGGCVFATAFSAQRAIAPFAGLSLTLFTCVLGAALLGFALGCGFGAGRATPEHGDPPAARALIIAAALTLTAAALRRPVLLALSGMELRFVVLVASVALAGVPCALIGFGFAAGTTGSDAAGALKSAAWLIAGAALAAPLTGWLLVPHLGLTLTLAIVAAAEGAVAGLIGYRRSPVATAVRVALVLLASAFVGTRPAVAARIGPRMLEQRQGHNVEYRVFDRDGARYLLADGTIHAVIDTLSGDCVQRGPAALGLLRLMRPGRDSLLVLGLRGGALPLSFARAGWRVRVVEPDSDAVAVSRRVAYKPGELPLTIADPRAFIAHDTGKHSVIVVDAFADSYLPYPLMTREFVALAADRLNDDGMLVMIVEAHGWGDPLIGSLGATLRTCFAHVLALPTSEPQTALGTILLVATRQAVKFTDDDLPDPRTFFLNPDALWVEQQQSHAWLNRYAPQPANAPVLTDDKSMAEVWSDRLNHAARAELHTFFGPYGGSW